MTITHRISPGDNPPALGAPADLASQLQGMIGQAAGLSGAGVGLPALNSLGSSISALAGTLSGAISGAGATIATTLAGLGTSMAGASMAGMASLVTSMQGQLTSLMAAINPGGLISQVLHTHTLDAAKGIVHSAFQGQHVTTLGSGGIQHVSSALVKLAAPNIPLNGAVAGSDTLAMVKGVTGASFGVTSDERLKSNIQPYAVTIEAGMQLQVMTFDKRYVSYDDFGKPSIHDDFAPTFGLIAQHTRRVLPELVRGDEATGFLEVDEGKIGIVTLAMLQQFIVETRSEIADLKKQLSER